MSSTEVRASIAGIGSCHASHRAAIVRFNAVGSRDSAFARCSLIGNDSCHIVLFVVNGIA